MEIIKFICSAYFVVMGLCLLILFLSGQTNHASYLASYSIGGCFCASVILGVRMFFEK